jgi:hypothetical protein
MTIAAGFARCRSISLHQPTGNWRRSGTSPGSVDLTWIEAACRRQTASFVQGPRADLRDAAGGGAVLVLALTKATGSLLAAHGGVE